MRLAPVVNNSIALLSLDLLNKAVPLVVFPCVVRALGPATYGRLGFATAVAGFFGLLASPGFSTYALREAAKNHNRISFLVQHVLGARIAFAAGAYVLLLIYAVSFVPRDGTTPLLVALSGLAFVAASIDTQWIFAANSRMWMIATRGAVSQLAYAALILALVHHAREVWIIPVAALISGALSALLAWLPARREYGIPKPAISPQAWRLFLPACLAMGSASLMSMIYDQIDTIMLKYFRSDAELGMYVASYGLMTMAMSFLPILSQLFMPLLSSAAGQDAAAEKKYLYWAAHAAVGLALPIAVGGFLLAGPLTGFVLGGDYAGSGTLFRWLMPTVLTGTAASYYGAQLIPNGRERKYLIAVSAGAVANVGLNFMFIPKYGALAAAFTTASSQGLVALMNYLFTRDLPQPNLADAVGISIFATGIMALSLVTLRNLFAVHIVMEVGLAALLYGGVYVLALGLRDRIGAMRAQLDPS